MRKIFIADAHLRRHQDFNYQVLLNFLATLEGNTETVFILGDLFEFWVGYPRLVFPEYLPVLDQLKALVAAGTRIVYFEGNHDFHMGRYFADTLGAEIHPGPALLEMDGKKIFLCHGDQINRKDYRYRFLRALLHNRVSGTLIPLAPVALASFIARRMSEGSSRKHEGRRRAWDYPSLIRNFASQKLAEGCDAVVTGHFHTPFLERHGLNGDKLILSLGDWISQFSYGEWENGVITLKAFR